MDDLAAAARLANERDETDRLLDALGPPAARRAADEWRASLKLLRAVRLSPDLATCEAVLRGERVARSRLDPGWAKAYGL